MREPRIGHDSPERHLTERSLRDQLVPVAVTVVRCLGIIEVPDAQPIQPERAIELRDHAVEVVHEVVARRVHMAGVHADADPPGQRGREGRDDGGQFLECGTERGAGAGGGLEAENRVPGLVVQRLRDRRRVARDAGVAIVHVVAGV